MSNDDETNPTLDALIENPADFIAFEDEVMLVDWADTPRGGMMVKFVIPGEYDSHPFRRFMLQNETRKGTRFFARLIEIADDDTPINQRVRAQVHAVMEKREGQGHRVSQEAGMLCRNPLFHAYVRAIVFEAGRDDETRKLIIDRLPVGIAKELKAHGPRLFDNATMASEVCAFFVYAVCNVKTRRELDFHPRKALKFSNLIVQPYQTWREHRRIPDRVPGEDDDLGDVPDGAGGHTKGYGRHRE